MGVFACWVLLHSPRRTAAADVLHVIQEEKNLGGNLLVRANVGLLLLAGQETRADDAVVGVQQLTHSR